ncbi:hypothetical protein GT23_0682 [Parageobacillus thermoglucosidasius]|nr:hypothetical protein GT23_0682 [Parageobacillus thermoglucosidasius]
MNFMSLFFDKSLISIYPDNAELRLRMQAGPKTGGSRRFRSFLFGG